MKRPAHNHLGFDFVICVEDFNYTPGKKKARNAPKHDDIHNDLKKKKKRAPKSYAKLYKLLRRVYECEDVTDEEMKKVKFSSGLPVDHIVKVVKWMFIEQDIRYWNYSGREKTWREVIPEP